jgi:hypothetical protein
VTDTQTGLIWLQDASCLGSNSWAAANRAAADLKDGDCGGKLTDKSSPGDWRLPTGDEWSAMTALAVRHCTNPNGPNLTNDEGTACLSVGPSSFVAVASEPYWSSTTSAIFSSAAFVTDLNQGAGFNDRLKSQIVLMWPVRGGPR